MGMSLHEVYSLTPEELDPVFKAWNRKEEAAARDRWERTRFLACCMLAPYSKKKLRPADIIRFDWEKPEPDCKPKKTTDEDIKRMKRRFGIG